MKFIDIRQDRWHTLGGEDGPMPSPNPAPNLLLTLEQWHAVREHWTPGLLAGVKLPNHVDVEVLEPDLPRLGLVALDFPKWIDGRAYSQARLLRARYRFGGEVRATGEVVVDMLPLLARTGFDAVVMRPGYKQESADLALRIVPTHYQGDVTVRQPIFARTAA